MNIEIDLPEGWKFDTLGKACNIIMGQSPSSDTYNSEGLGLPFFQGKAEFTELHPITRKWCSEPNKIAEPNDILLSVRAPVGAANIANQKCCIGRGLAAIRYSNPKYVFYYLRLIEQELDKKGTGTTFRAISGEILRSTIIPIAPPYEEKQIVEKIEELFSELDKGIENLKIAQQQLKVYRQAVLKWAFEGKLTNENVKDGELPEGWEWVTIDQLLSNKKKGMTTGPFGTALRKSEHQLNGIPVLGIENIGEGIFRMPNKIFITKEKAAELKSFMVFTDDIIISRSGTVGEICSVPSFMDKSIISTNLIKVSINKDIINPKYFVYMFQGGKVTMQVKELCKGSSRAFLNQTILSNLEFPLCSITEQKEVVQEIESRLSVCDKMEEAITTSLQQADALRQSILKRAFEGKLVNVDLVTCIAGTN